MKYEEQTIEGRNAVLEAFRSGKTIDKLYVLKGCQDGLVTEEEIGRAAERLFTTRFLLGLFDETEYDKIGYDRIECKEHLETAARATAESLVLLKNNGILPLDKKP